MLSFFDASEKCAKAMLKSQEKCAKRVPKITEKCVKISIYLISKIFLKGISFNF